MGKGLPGVLVVRGRRYVLCAALVNTRHDHAPSNLTLLPPQHSIALAGGEEFLTLYVPESVLPPGWAESMKEPG